MSRPHTVAVYPGESPNYGLIIQGSGRSDIASSEWHVPAARPLLIVDHGPKRSQSSGIAALQSPPAAIALDDISATADVGTAKGEYTTACIGQNANCALRGASTDTYIKEAALRFPGTWGWHDMIRVGGRAGDISRALLYFDLKAVPHDASIKEAKLVLSLIRRKA
ncbi:MAG: hypothetical protein ABSG68_10885 [Thermoguttaceae bacterium]|jgi:hypothetical protein